MSDFDPNDPKQAETLRALLTDIFDFGDDEGQSIKDIREKLKGLNLPTADALLNAVRDVLARNGVRKKDPLFELAQRAVHSGHWKWLPGMRTLAEVGYVCKGYYLTDRKHPSYPEEYDWPHDLGLRVPDFNCPVTRLSVLHLIRLAWKDDRIHVYPVQGGSDDIVGWNVGVFPWKLCGTGPTELDALVKALVAAPHR